MGEINTKRIDEIVQKTLRGETTFPEVVMELMEQGVESYHVDLIRGENRYYTVRAQSYATANFHTHANVPDEFSAERVVRAIRETQQGKIDYQTFIEQIVAAGCSFYIACLTGRKVMYFGRKGDFHTEHFPTAT